MVCSFLNSPISPSASSAFPCFRYNPASAKCACAERSLSFSSSITLVHAFSADALSSSAFVAASGSPTLAPYLDPKPGYVQQYNLDIQRELPGDIFIDVAFAGSHGVHLPQYSTHLNQIGDTFVAQAAAQAAAGQLPDIATLVSNPMAGTSQNATIGGPQIVAGQLDRAYPQYTDLNLAGYGCCGSTYNSLQVSATRRFQGGGTLLVAYTNAKLL